MGTHHSMGVRAAVTVIGLACAMPVFAQGKMRNLEISEDTNSLLGDAVDFVSNNLYLKIGAGYLDYSGDSTNLRIENAQGLAAQAFGPGQSDLDGTGSSLGDKMFPAGTIGLFIPWTGKHLAAEVTISAPIKLDFQVSGAAVNQSLAPDALNGNGANNSIDPGIPPIGRNIGTLKTFPPNLSFVYRPFVESTIQPYIGVGAMYLYTYDTDISNNLLNSVNEPTLYLSKPWACTAKAGIDVFFDDQFFISAEAQYLGCAEVKAELNGISVRADNLSGQLGDVDVGTVSTKNDFEAMLYQLSFGIRF